MWVDRRAWLRMSVCGGMQVVGERELEGKWREPETPRDLGEPEP